MSTCQEFYTCRYTEKNGRSESSNVLMSKFFIYPILAGVLLEKKWKNFEPVYNAHIDIIVHIFCKRGLQNFNNLFNIA